MRTNVEDDLAGEASDAPHQQPECQEAVAALQSLLSRGRVEEARRLAVELAARWPESDLLHRFARVLAPPVARIVKGGNGLTREQTRKESAWLRDHGQDHRGCWVILYGDQLLAAHPRLRTAIEEADGRAKGEIGSIHFIPPDVVEA